MLGFDVSEGTISCWMKRAPRDPESARRWPSFLRNHREAIAAVDFFSVVVRKNPVQQFFKPHETLLHPDRLGDATQVPALVAGFKGVQAG
jgi:hypothetical protein